MSLSPGTRFGSYEIADEIGAGGMGIVYRARDTSLKRHVAIKVLPESLATDEERLTRFQREAELLASLNHPNIAQIYGLEEGDGTTALVMELVEGPTLEDRIKQGALPSDEALSIAMQISEALEGAHGQGIVHRDLKPANIKLRPDGVVKVLDFGIAKALEPDVLTSEPQSPMLTTPATQVGVILGTAAYMSPEQARGKQVDQRADIWAFGCVLYEMLTGQPVFSGEDVSVTLARVLEREIDLDSLPARTSPAVRQTMQLCLQKDIRKRMADIRDVRLALEGAFATVSPRAAQAAALAAWRRVLPYAATAAAAVLVAGITAWSFWPTRGPQPTARLAISHPSMQGIGRSLSDADMAVSPDGQHVAYVAGPEQQAQQQLYLRPLDQLEPALLADLARMPFFSPDAQWVGFVEAGRLLSRVARTGGPSLPIHDLAGAPRGATWGSDDTIIFATTAEPTGLIRIPAGGGDEEVLTIPDSANGEVGHLFPEYLPGVRAVLFTITNDQGIDSSQIAVLDLATGEYTVLIQGGHYARYSASGHIVYGVSGTLRAVAFDLDRLEVRGTPVPVLDGVLTKPTGAVSFGIAANGTLIYVPGGAEVGLLRTVVWVDRDGREEALAAEPAFYRGVRISPDENGARVVLDGRSQGNPLWVWDFAAETRIRLNIGDAGGDAAVWSPDRARIAYHPTQGNMIDWRPANNTGSPERLATDPASAGNVHAYFFTPSGAELVFEGQASPETDMDIGMVSVNGDAETTWLLREPYVQRHADLSPDGRWMAYQSNDSGRQEIYVVPFPNVGDKVAVSNAGGIRPLWSRDGSELFYIEPGSPARLIAASVEASEAGFSFGARTPILDWPYVSEGGGFRTYDVSPDGRRFLAIKEGAIEGTVPQIIVVRNWLEELERLVPSD